MLNSFICGSFHPEEGGDDEPYWNNFPRSPGKTRRHSLLRRSNNSYIGKESKNPYANRGLDKFSALVADLEEKRKEIYLQSGSREIAFVRFVTSSSDEFVPVIVKSKDPHHPHHQNKEKKKAERSEARKKIANATHDSEAMVESPEEVKAVDEPKVELNEEAKRMSFSWGRLSCRVPLAIIMILLLLALFGRSFAILCTSIGWYMVPALRGRSSTVVKKKMETSGKRVGEDKNIARTGGASSYPKSNDSKENGRTQQHGHCKSW